MPLFEVCEATNLQVPVEAADVDAGGVPVVVLQCVVVQDVYDGADDGGGVPGDPVKQFS